MANIDLFAAKALQLIQGRSGKYEVRIKRDEMGGAQ